MSKVLTTAEQQQRAKATARRKPVTIDDIAPDEELTPEEQAALDGSERSGPEQLSAALNPKSAQVPGAPDWAIIPPDLKFPPGAEVAFFNIELNYPKGTKRQIIIWELSARDERMGRARSFGSDTRLLEEMTKQMIRAVDGKTVNWANPLEIEKVWDEIGAKYRNFLIAWYMKAHQLDEAERLTFFANNVAALRAV